MYKEDDWVSDEVEEEREMSEEIDYEFLMEEPDYDEAAFRYEKSLEYSFWDQ